ncbi:MAG: hypothetical protein AMXMBFR56_53340 [Polyangiaceae bacterium]
MVGTKIKGILLDEVLHLGNEGRLDGIERSHSGETRQFGA